MFFTSKLMYATGKKALCFLGVIVMSQTAFAQVKIGDNPTIVKNASLLELESTNRGLAFPRVSLAGAVTNPAPLSTDLLDGTVIFNTNAAFTAGTGLFVWNNGAWNALTAPTINTGNFWNITGNAGTTAANNFLGTTDNKSLSFRTNNINRIIIDSLGSVGIGSTAFDATNRERLLVDYGTTTSHTLATFRGDINEYLQVNLKNSNNGINASTDYVATADNGDETSAYVDMGINSSGYAPSVDNWGGPNDGYLYANARNLLIGTQSSGSDIVFLVNGGVIKSNAALRINGTNSNIVVGRGDGSNTPVGNIIRAANGNASATVAADLTLQGGQSLKPGLAGGNLILNGGVSATSTYGYITLNTTNLERMRITPAGNVGIGTATPNTKLEITQGTAGNSGLRFTNLLSTNTAATGIGKFLSVNTTGDVVLTDGAGLLTVGTPNTTSTANAATITGTVLQLSPADATNPGIVTTGAQTIAGAKTFTGSTAITNTYKLGANGTTYKNQISFTASYTSFFLFLYGTYNVDFTIPAANLPSSTRATVTVSPAGDLAAGVIIGYAYLTSTTNVRVRFQSTNLLSFNFTPGTFYFTITEY